MSHAENPYPNKLRGNLVDHAAKLAGKGTVAAAVTVRPEIRDAFLGPKGREIRDEPGAPVIPEGYNMPSEALERIRRIKETPGIEPHTDPLGLVLPGLYTSEVDDRLRYVVDVVTYQRDPTRPKKEDAIVHIAGDGVVTRVPLESLQEKVKEGRLVAVPPPSPTT